MQGFLKLILNRTYKLKGKKVSISILDVKYYQLVSFEKEIRIIFTKRFYKKIVFIKTVVFYQKKLNIIFL